MSGSIVSLWIKPAHGHSMKAVSSAELIEGRGIRGNADQGGWRHVTIIDEAAWKQAEADLGVAIDPSARRANVLVRGLDLRESRGKLLRLGDAVIRLAGETKPCQQMDDAHDGLRAALGPEWRAGAYGQIIEGGTIRPGDRAEVSTLLRYRRRLPGTDFMASPLGIGDVADPSLPIEHCVGLLRRAIDAGLNVVDTAPNYENGLSEKIVARAVKQDRDSLFVIDKIDDHGAPVEPQIDASLARLGTHADVFVFHGVSNMEVFRKLRFDELTRCVEAGKVRYRGISSHHPDVLQAALEAGVCDIVMFPVGPFVDRRYIEEILPLAREKGVGAVSFKTFGAGKLVADTSGYNQPLEGASGLPKLTAKECLHYTLTIDPDVAILGLSSSEDQDESFEAALTFRPLRSKEMASIEERAAVARQGKGACWWNPDPQA
jgi:1-deoxyxylulose-5-phosphate synthase